MTLCDCDNHPSDDNSRFYVRPYCANPFCWESMLRTASNDSFEGVLHGQTNTVYGNYNREVRCPSCNKGLDYPQLNQGFIVERRRLTIQELSSRFSNVPTVQTDQNNTARTVFNNAMNFQMGSAGLQLQFLFAARY
jgi:hypothetical protein